MDAERITELKAMVGAATELPWRDSGAGRSKHMIYAGVHTPVADTGWCSVQQGKANAALIVAAVNALPALIGEVERLAGECERLRGVALDAVPSNWCDPLMTGPEGIGRGPYTGTDIEVLLMRVRQRISAALTQPEGEGS